MTVETTSNISVHRGNGATTTFPFNFKVLDESHLVVTRRLYPDGAVIETYAPTDYSVSGIGTPSGSVTLDGDPVSDDYEIVITRTVPYRQDLDIVNAGGFYPTTVEEQLDLLVMQIQQVAKLAAAAVRLAPGTDLTYASGDPAGKFLAFTPAGLPYFTDGLGADASLRADLASTILSGASLVAVSAGTTPLSLVDVQAAIENVFGTGTVHGTALGLIDSPNDQWEKFNEVIQYCSAEKITLDISGLEIRLDTQKTTDPNYLYLAFRTEAVTGTFQLGETVRGQSSNATIVLDEIVTDYAGPSRRRLGGTITGTFQVGENLLGLTSGATSTLSQLSVYAVKIPANGWMRIVGDGTIGNLNENSGQSLFFAEEAEYVEIGDGVRIDGYQSVAERSSSPVQAYGCTRVHLGACHLYRCGIWRNGASPNGMTELCTFTTPEFSYCLGTHCIGGKPGGCKEWRGNVLKFSHSRGGWNIEAEDQDGFNDAGLWPSRVVASAQAVIATDMCGDALELSGAVDRSNYSTVAVADSLEAIVSIGAVITLRATASNGNASCVVVGAGQTNNPATSVHIASIYAEAIRTILQYTPTMTGGESIIIGAVTGKTSTDPQVARVLAYDNGSASFTIGERVTGAGGAFGDVLTFSETGTSPNLAGRLYLTNVEGTFVDNENLTGDIAGVALVNGTLNTGGGGVGQILNAIPLNGISGTVGKAKLIYFGEIEVDQLGYVNNPAAGLEGFYVNNDSGVAGDIIETLRIGTLKVGDSKTHLFAMKDLEEFVWDEISSTNIVGNKSSSFASGHAVHIVATRLRGKTRWYQEDALAQIYLEVSESAVISGFDIVDTQANGALETAGAGSFLLKDGQIRDSANANGLWNNGTGTVRLSNFNLNGKGITGTNPVTSIVGGDVLDGIAVADLPAAADMEAGTTARVIDASAPSVGSNVAGGGSAQAGVVNNQTNWKVWWT